MIDLADKVSAVILAGGLSSRMGTCKAELMWNGKTLIEHQSDKMRQLGIGDIVISGYAVPVDGTRYAPDIYTRKGPLGGIHAGLLAAKHPHCLVTGIDTPLVPLDALSGLICEHIRQGEDITLLAHSGRIEPIIGVYERHLAAAAEPILQTDSTSVRVLLRQAGYREYRYTGDEFLLCDCNTPEQFAAAAAMPLNNL